MINSYRFERWENLAFGIHGSHPTSLTMDLISHPHFSSLYRVSRSPSGHLSFIYTSSSSSFHFQWCIILSKIDFSPLVSMRNSSFHFQLVPCQNGQCVSHFYVLSRLSDPPRIIYNGETRLIVILGPWWFSPILASSASCFVSPYICASGSIISNCSKCDS